MRVFTRSILAALVAIAVLISAPVLAQTDTPTETPTNTPTNTPTQTPTNTHTSTPTFTPDQREITPVRPAERVKRAELIRAYDPALKQAALAEWVEGTEREVHRIGASVRQVVVPGINGGTPTALSQPTGVARVHSILAITTSSGAAAAKLLLDEGSSDDFTVADGIITIRTNQSANTLIITYEPSGS